MVWSINSNFSVSLGKTEETEKSEKTSEVKNSNEKSKSSEETVSSYSKFDTVSISAEGAEYVKNAAASGENQAMNDTTQQAAVSSASTDATVNTQTSTVSESSEEDSTDDLSEYSDSELKLMMYTGEITRSEYESEMAGRGTAVIEE